MRRLCLISLMLCFAVLLSAAPSDAHPLLWWVNLLLRSTEPSYNVGTRCGAHYTATDGYDTGDQPTPQAYKTGPGIVVHKVAGQDGWDGPTGFYQDDFRSLPGPGETKTWDLWLWTKDYSLSGDVVVAEVRVPSFPSPGHRGELVIDYVPPSIDWQGPWVIPINLGESPVWRSYVTLPVPLVTDPYDPSQVMRMHLSVTAPVPEPSSLAALSIGLAPIAGMALRRRRRG